MTEEKSAISNTPPMEKPPSTEGGAKGKSREKVRFIVEREFHGTQTMTEAFQNMIELRARAKLREWLENGESAG